MFCMTYGTQTPENELVEAARKGDKEAFDRLMSRYQDYIYRLMMRACSHPEDAEEVTSEAFLRAYQNLAQFEGRSSFVTWLGKIAANLCLHRRSKTHAEQVRRVRGQKGGSYPAPLPPASEPTPEQEALRRETKRCIQAAIDELPEPDRMVLRLRDVEQLSTAEVSAQTGLSEPAVKARLHRARLRLRERLNAYFLPEADE